MQRLVRMLSILCIASVFFFSSGERGYGELLRYEFIEEVSGAKYGELTLASIPAGYEDIETLVFTSVGETEFGLGSIYQGSFDFGVYEITKFVDGLATTGEAGHVVDLDPPPSVVVLGADRFEIGFRRPSNLDYMLLRGSNGEVRVDGNWLAVPEPNWLHLIFLPMLFGRGWRMKRLAA